jgi:hypothetical protein
MSYGHHQSKEHGVNFPPFGAYQIGRNHGLPMARLQGVQAT